MPWKVEGKIGCHYPDRSQPNFDTDNIIFCPNGSTANSAQIEKVYYIPPGVTNITVNDLPQYGIWRRYWENPPAQLQLVRGSNGVLIEYIPSTDITLNSFGIFEDNGNTSLTNDNFRIFNEAGIQIAFLGTGTIVSNEVVKYGLTGHIRTGNMGTVQLQTGKKYYFLFQTDSNQSSNATPALFYNETGVIRQTYSQQSDTETTTANVSNWNDYITGANSTQLVNNFLQSNEYDYMNWEFNSEYGFSQNVVYVRSNYNCPTGNFIGNVGGISNNDYFRILDTSPNDLFIWNGNNGMGVNNSTIYKTTNELRGTYSLGKLTADEQVISAAASSTFVFAGNSQGGLQQNKIYKKLVSAIPSYSTSQNGEGDKLAEMFMKNQTPGNIIIPLHTIYYMGQNKIWGRKDVGSIQITTMTPQDDWSTLSSNVVNSGIYYLKSNASFPGINLWENSVAQYVDGTFHKIDNDNNNQYHLSAFYDLLNLNAPTIVTEYSTFTDNTNTILSAIGSVQSMYSSTAQPQTAFLNTTFGDARYYLEINGQEVNTPS